MAPHDGIEIGIRVSATVKADRDRPEEVIAREVSRGLASITDPRRRDEGILGYSVESVGPDALTLKVCVLPGRGNSLEDTTYATLTSIRKCLDPITNYLRRDDGLLSFALDDAPELSVDYPRHGF